MLDNLKVIKTMRGIKRAFDGLPGAPDCRTWDGYKVILRQQPESLIEPGWSRFYEFRPDGRPIAISMNHECTCDILSVTLAARGASPDTSTGSCWSIHRVCL
jgi:hypothetical protein